MNESGDYHVKQNMPDSKANVTYCLSYAKSLRVSGTCRSRKEEIIRDGRVHIFKYIVCMHTYSIMKPTKLFLKNEPE
jgi:hypothetical protein